MTVACAWTWMMTTCSTMRCMVMSPVSRDSWLSGLDWA